MTHRLTYYSTNRTLSGAPILDNFPTALLQGLAADEGLYMPSRIPAFEIGELQALRSKHYHEVACAVLYKFLEGELPREELAEMCKRVYHFPILLELLDEKTTVARLDQGATASFKDFAAQMMGQWFAYFKPKGQKLTILVATSGDTGSAVGEAFKALPDTQVVILYPEKEVSAVQKHQLDSIGGNTRAVSLAGKFDDCQAFVKRAFADADLAHLGLSSANSINIGRVLPQVAYYVYLWLQLAETAQEHINFCVPSGNLGNSLGCEVARRMGVPVGKLLIATNRNDAFPTFLREGVYHKIEPSIECVSNAMNVGNPSNLARYFDLYGGCVDKNGTVHAAPRLQEMREHLHSEVISDEETLETIVHIYKKYNVVLEPHGAIAVAAAQRQDLAGKTVCLETAHPAKFDLMAKILPIEIEKSETLQAIEGRVGEALQMPCDYARFKKFLLGL